MKRIAWLAASLIVLLGVIPAHAAGAKPKALRIGIVTFFSGSGAVAGGPAIDSAKMAIDAINKSGGIDGVPVEPQYVDEAGGPTKQVAEFRSLAGHVAAVIGYVSSADCLAIEPVAEQLHVLTIFSDCDSNLLYKWPASEWLFHAVPPLSTSALAMAFYVAKNYPHLKTIAGLNPDYAYGRDHWKYFTLAMQRLESGVKLGTALFPALFSGHYTSELSRLQGERPNLIYASMWGGDLIALIQQASAQDAFRQSMFVLPEGTEGGSEALSAMPAGVAAGAGHGNLMHPGSVGSQNAAAFIAAYHKRFGSYPITPDPFTMQRAILTLRAGYQAAIKAGGGSWPNSAQVSHALVGVHVKTPFDTFRIRRDHVATVGEWVGTSVRSSSYPFAVFNRIVDFPFSQLMAPVGESADSWIGKLTPAALAHVPAPREDKP
jgi:branched-chain amino acid transport system substrate-binding protein